MGMAKSPSSKENLSVLKVTFTNLLKDILRCKARGEVGHKRVHAVRRKLEDVATALKIDVRSIQEQLIEHCSLFCKEPIVLGTIIQLVQALDIVKTVNENVKDTCGQVSKEVEQLNTEFGKYYQDTIELDQDACNALFYIEEIQKDRKNWEKEKLEWGQRLRDKFREQFRNQFITTISQERKDKELYKRKLDWLEQKMKIENPTSYATYKNGFKNSEANPILSVKQQHELETALHSQQERAGKRGRSRDPLNRGSASTADTDELNALFDKLGKKRNYNDIEDALFQKINNLNDAYGGNQNVPSNLKELYKKYLQRQSTSTGSGDGTDKKRKRSKSQSVLQDTSNRNISMIARGRSPGAPGRDVGGANFEMVLKALRLIPRVVDTSPNREVTSGPQGGALMDMITETTEYLKQLLEIGSTQQYNIEHGFSPLSVRGDIRNQSKSSHLQYSQNTSRVSPPLTERDIGEIPRSPSCPRHNLQTATDYYHKNKPSQSLSPKPLSPTDTDYYQNNKPTRPLSAKPLSPTDTDYYQNNKPTQPLSPGGTNYHQNNKRPRSSSPSRASPYGMDYNLEEVLSQSPRLRTHNNRLVINDEIPNYSNNYTGSTKDMIRGIITERDDSYHPSHNISSGKGSPNYLDGSYREVIDHSYDERYHHNDVAPHSHRHYSHYGKEDDYGNGDESVHQGINQELYDKYLGSGRYDGQNNIPSARYRERERWKIEKDLSPRTLVHPDIDLFSNDNDDWRQEFNETMQSQLPQSPCHIDITDGLLDCSFHPRDPECKLSPQPASRLPHRHHRNGSKNRSKSPFGSLFPGTLFQDKRESTDVILAKTPPFQTRKGVMSPSQQSSPHTASRIIRTPNDPSIPIPVQPLKYPSDPDLEHFFNNIDIEDTTPLQYTRKGIQISSQRSSPGIGTRNNIPTVQSPVYKQTNNPENEVFPIIKQNIDLGGNITYHPTKKQSSDEIKIQKQRKENWEEFPPSPNTYEIREMLKQSKTKNELDQLQNIYHHITKNLTQSSVTENITGDGLLRFTPRNNNKIDSPQSNKKNNNMTADVSLRSTSKNYNKDNTPESGRHNYNLQQSYNNDSIDLQQFNNNISENLSSPRLYRGSIILGEKDSALQKDVYSSLVSSNKHYHIPSNKNLTEKFIKRRG